MIVADASVIVTIVAGDETGIALARRLFRTREVVCAPHLMDIEVAHVLRRYERVGLLSKEGAGWALQALGLLPITRYPHEPLMKRIWQLRGHVTAYDAAYVALAEGVRGKLLTRDARLAAVPGLELDIELV